MRLEIQRSCGDDGFDLCAPVERRKRTWGSHLKQRIFRTPWATGEEEVAGHEMESQVFAEDNGCPHTRPSRKVMTSLEILYFEAISFVEKWRTMGVLENWSEVYKKVRYALMFCSVFL